MPFKVGDKVEYTGPSCEMYPPPCTVIKIVGKQIWFCVDAKAPNEQWAEHMHFKLLKSISPLKELMNRIASSL